MPTQFPEWAETTTPLAKEAAFTSAPRATGSRDVFIVGTVYADKAGTLHIEQSPDGTNWDVDTSYEIAAGDGKGFSERSVGAYARIRYVNGATIQGAFRLSVGTKVA